MPDRLLHEVEWPSSPFGHQWPVHTLPSNEVFMEKVSLHSNQRDPLGPRETTDHVPYATQRPSGTGQ